MRLQRFHRPPRRFWTILVLAVLFGLWAGSDYLTSHVPQVLRLRCEGKMRQALQGRQILAACDMDGRFPADVMEGKPVYAPLSLAVDGVDDGARRLAGDAGIMVRFRARWHLCSTNYSIFVRLAFHRKSPETQTIFMANAPAPLELSVKDRRLRLVVPTADGAAATLEASDPISAGQWRRFHSVVATIDGDHRRATLHLDGKVVAAADLCPAPPEAHVVTLGGESFHPLQADVDEFVVWKRVLPPQEVRDVSGLHYSFARAAAPLVARLIPLVDAYERFGTACHGMLRRIVARMPSAIEGVPLKSLDLKLSSADQRHFVRAHARSFHSGFRTRKGARWRTVSLSTADGPRDVELALDNAYAFEFFSGRPAYLLHLLPDAAGEAPRYYRLFPAEDYLAFHYGDDAPFETDPSAYVHLHVNHQSQGLYVVEPFTQNTSGAVVDIYGRSRNSLALQQPPRPFRPSDALSPADRSALLRRLRKTIARSPGVVLSKSTLRALVENARGQAALFPPVTADAALACGANRSPWFVTGDLDLSHPAFASVARWHSSAPDVIADDGRVQSGALSVPTAVTLAGEAADGTPVASLRFRVMPPRRALPTCFLWTATPPTKELRSDFILCHLPAGDTTNATWLTGFGATGAGLHQRGNTSYVKGVKKPLSLKFDAPHHLLGTSESRTLFLLNGYSDNTRLRNAISYDTFRAMASAAPPGAPFLAPRIGWCELFINGAYLGVFEMCERVAAPLFPGRPVELFRVKASTPLFNEVSSRAFVQVDPNPEERSCEGTLLDLMRITTDPDPAVTRRAIAEAADVDNLISFILLVNFTGNFDGRTTNFVLARDPTAPHPISLVPWDYDKTFLLNTPPARIENHLTGRLLGDPAFRRATKARWQALRAPGAPLDEAVLLRWVDSHAAVLAPYMPFEYELVGASTDFATEIALLSEKIRAHLAFMDGWIGSFPD